MSRRAPRRASDANWEREERFRVALAAAPIVVFNQDLELRYTWIGNPALGLKVEEGIGRTDAELLGPEMAAPVVAIKRRVLATGVGGRLEVHLARQGHSGWYDLTVEPLRDAAGRIAGVTCVAVDITARKRTEESLRKSDAGLRAAERIAAIGHWFMDLTTCAVSWSEGMYAIFGLDPAAGPPAWPTGHRPLVHPDDWEALFTIIADCLANRRAYELTCRFHRPDGTAGHLRVIGQPLAGTGAEVREFIGIVQDITAQKRLEAERAAALARLAVAEEEERHRLARELHDQTAQRLVALAVELKTLESNLAAGRSQAGRVRSLRRAVDELQQQVRQIAWNLRAVELSQGDLESVLREYVDDWSERAGVTVDCECRGLGGSRLPAALEVTLYRVAQEALANVEKHAAARCVSVLLEREPGRVRLTVEDDGRGFDPDAFPESPDGPRRLGLMGMKERVALAGGTLLVESAPGAGTTVLVRLPLPAETGHPASPGAADPR